MAKKKKVNQSETLIRKGIALVASVVTFVFFFLEMIALKSVGKNILTGKKVVDTKGEKVSDFLFNSDYELFRETYSIANTVLWIAFVLVVLSVVALVASLLLKKNGTLVAKIGAGLLVLGLLVMFIINVDKTDVVVTYYTNVTVLYFIALALSFVGFASVVTLKK